jgi:uncharacterized spore protein YtfJ
MEQKEWVNTKPIEQLMGDLGVHSVFGEPTREQGAVVIPVAQLVFGFGYGGGYGAGPAKPGRAEGAGEETEGAEGGSEGGGAGAGGRATPRGYIRITPEGVKYEPIQNEVVIPVAGIVMVAWSVFWISATVRYVAKMVAKTKQAQRR